MNRMLQAAPWLPVVAFVLSSVAPAAEPATAPAMPAIEAGRPVTDAPVWALLERELFDAMHAAARAALDKYVRDDGSILWPPDPQGFRSIDALDDAYESFHNWPLLYLLGGDEWFLQAGRREWEAITEQFSHYPTGRGYPMVVKEYQPSYDWMHQGEGNYLFYMLSMADPTDEKTVERARRFAGFYLNEDPDAKNYDPEHKIIRCAHNGSKGPGFWNFDGKPVWTAEGYGLPFWDVEGAETVADLEDKGVAERMGRIASERRGKGDAAANLACTGLLANAYLLTGDDKYKQWVVGYVDAWIDRVKANDGILPDNVGLNGKIGEHIDGRWYGGNYGWTWPHGWGNLGQAVIIAAETATLLTRDRTYMDLPRGQIDVLIDRGIVTDKTLHVPHKYGAPGKVRYTPWPWLMVLRNEDDTALQKDGWFEFMPMNPQFIAHVWNVSLDEADVRREHVLRNKSGRRFAAGPPLQINDWSAKDQGGNSGAWMAYLNGQFPDYPEKILRHNLSQVYSRSAFMRRDDQDPAKYNDSYFQRRNPVTCEGLVQMTTGSPLPIYNGGLLVCQVRHFDALERRPGLPDDVAALVSGIAENRIVLELVNLNLTERREVIVQAGGMAEHRFTTASYDQAAGRRSRRASVEVNGPHLRVALPPGCGTRIELGVERFVNDPTYATPWD